MLNKDLNPLVVGSTLFLLYIIQSVLPVKWEALDVLQHEQMYSRWSGLVLALFILFQWLLTLTRVVNKWKKHSIKFTSWHKWIGAISPLIFFFHSMEFGYAYLFVLSFVFMVNMVLGTINLDVIKSSKEWVFQSWMITHVAFSFIITFVMLYHVGVVFYYK